MLPNAQLAYFSSLVSHLAWFTLDWSPSSFKSTKRGSTGVINKVSSCLSSTTKSSARPAADVVAAIVPPPTPPLTLTRCLWLNFQHGHPFHVRLLRDGGCPVGMGGMLGSARTAKCVASLITYRREVRVVRYPRAPQQNIFFVGRRTESILSVPGTPNPATIAPSGRQEKYTGSIQTLRRAIAGERCPFVIRRSQCSSHACRAQHCRDERHLRRYLSVGYCTMTRIISLLPFIGRRHR